MDAVDLSFNLDAAAAAFFYLYLSDFLSIRQTKVAMIKIITRTGMI